MGDLNVSVTSRSDKVLNYLIGTIALFMVVLHMYYAYTRGFETIIIMNAHLGLILILVFLNKLRKKSKPIFYKILMVLCICATIPCILYIHFNHVDIELRLWANTRLDLAVGVTLIVVTVIASVLGFGWFLPILIVAVTLYPLFGKYLPQPFTTRAYPFKQTIGMLSIGLQSGIYSNNLRTSAEMLFLFIIFGSVLSATKIQLFFWELGKLLFRNLRSGPGLMAVLNSALVGSVTGNASANVMITGVYTIPSMKAAGYRPEDAAAMEASASCGGHLMPPVMGASAFIMASYTGIPYLKIVSMALIPAFLYYLCCGLSAYFIVYKQNIKTDNLDFVKEKVNYRLFFWKTPGFVIPLTTIVVLLANGMSVMTTAFWAVICLIVLSFLVPKDLRPSWKDILNGLIDGANQGATLGVIVCAIGLMLVTFTSTGLAVKIGGGIMKLSGGSMFVILLMLWIMNILFGMIGVVSAGYYMGAAFGAGALMKLGLPLETTHFFIMFTTVFASITPPVALCCVVAAKLAGADYVKTAISTCRTAFIAFFLPFLVIYAPGLMLMRSPSEALFWIEILTAILIVVLGQLSFVGYFLTEMNLLERLLIGVSALLFFVSLMFMNYIPVVIWIGGLILVAVFLILHIPRYIAGKKQPRPGLQAE
jgi:TRAP transporter 4TM/12TM fusion protein